MEDTNVQRMLAGKTRNTSMEVFLGFEAVKSVATLFSQYASLGGDEMAGCNDPCFENLPENALPITQAQLHAAKQALGYIAQLIAPIEAQIPDAVWAAIEVLNMREETNG